MPHGQRDAEAFAEFPAEGFVTLRFFAADPVIDVQGGNARKPKLPRELRQKQQQADGITAPGKRADNALARSEQGIITDIFRRPSFHQALPLPFSGPGTFLRPVFPFIRSVLR